VIDYARARREFPKQKAALTRAIKTGDVNKIRAACAKAVAEWDAVGAWPDDWARWERALNDALPWYENEDLRDLA
jgi:hypothetical protein